MRKKKQIVVFISILLILICAGGYMRELLMQYPLIVLEQDELYGDAGQNLKDI